MRPCTADPLHCLADCRVRFACAMLAAARDVQMPDGSGAVQVGHLGTASAPSSCAPMACDGMPLVPFSACVCVHLPQSLLSVLQIRVGIASGPAQSGIIGSVRRRYCLVGNT